MNKFKVGDKIVGNALNKDCEYYITVKGWVGKVSRVINDEEIRVEPGNYLVKSEFFDFQNPLTVYKCIKAYPGFKLGDTSTEDQSAFPEYWLKEEVFKAGEFVTIVSCMFTLSSFNIGGTYKLIQDYSSSTGQFTVEADNSGTRNGYSGYCNYFTSPTHRITVRAATKEEIENYSLRLLGKYPIIFKKHSVKIGCTEYIIEDVKALKTVLSLKNIQEKSLSFGEKSNEVEITLEIITKILNRLQDEK